MNGEKIDRPLAVVNRHSGLLEAMTKGWWATAQVLRRGFAVRKFMWDI